jgi:hypothetical protein
MHIFVQIHPNPGTELRSSFEELAEQLGGMRGLYFEMDGSFVWVDHGSVPPGQMDGMVYDRNGRLEYVEIKGVCNARQWIILCSAVCGHDAGQFEKGTELDYSEFDCSEMNRVARVHRVDEGNWTTIGQVASQLAT